MAGAAETEGLGVTPRVVVAAAGAGVGVGDGVASSVVTCEGGFRPHHE